MRWLALVSLLIAAPARAAVGCIGSEDPSCSWPTLDYVLEGSTLTLLLADWSTTASLRAKPDDSETNFLIGPHPSRAAVAEYFLGLSALHAGVAALLPRPYRTIWQAVWIGLEGGAVYHNFALGCRFALP